MEGDYQPKKMTSLAAQLIAERLVLEKMLDGAWDLEELNAHDRHRDFAATKITLLLDGCRVHMLVWNDTGLTR